jgi:hypothetical protein
MRVCMFCSAPVKFATEMLAPEMCVTWLVAHSLHPNFAESCCPLLHSA